MIENYFDRSWSKRIKEMSEYIPLGASVLDLGCGQMELKNHLTNNEYYPVDYIAKDETVLIYDFNKKQFPKIHTDVSFVSGVLEYIYPYKWFIKMITTHSDKCIISYSTTEKYSDMKFRRNNLWVNHLSRKELIRLFKKNGWNLIYKNNYPFFIFGKP